MKLGDPFDGVQICDYESTAHKDEICVIQMLFRNVTPVKYAFQL